ncbi:organic cation transporter protein-like isoform X2 [Dermacentor variabilis]|uniref:organic cation transporter protein-like isoform X2 n=1 Tax=Dermacentor variabilis TaxID=34621 RepID=UPI003F5C8AA4
MSDTDVTNVIGDYGKFQRNVYLFCLLRGIPNGLHLVIYSFFLPAVEHWCARPDGLAANVTSEQWKSLVLSSNSTSGAHLSSLRGGRCRTFDVELSGEGTPEFGNATVRCDRWEYGWSYYRSSLVQEWDLVCDRAWTRSLVQTATMSGMLVGTLVSSLGDRLGRRPMVIAGYVASLVGSVCVAVSPWFSLLLLFRGLLGLGLGLGQTASFCLLMEVIGPQKRTTTAVAFSFGFAIGIIMLPGFAWLLQDWRSLQAAISVPLLVFVVWSWYLPESPRWLIATGKMTAARKVILKACADNGQPVDDIDSVLGQLRKKILQCGERHDLLRPAALGDQPGRRPVPDVCPRRGRRVPRGRHLLRRHPVVPPALDHARRVRHRWSMRSRSGRTTARVGGASPDVRHRREDAGLRLADAGVDLRGRGVPDVVPHGRSQRLPGGHPCRFFDGTVSVGTENLLD